MGCAFSLRGPSAHRRSGLRKSLARTRGPVCSLGGGGFSGAEFAPFPYPLPPSSSRDGPALPWSFSVPLFCEPLAVCSSRLIFSLAIPQFKKAPSDCSQGLLAGPHPKQCRPLLSVLPPLAGGGCGRLEYFSGGVAFRQLWALFNFFSQSGCPPRFENFSQTHQHEGFLLIGNFLY